MDATSNERICSQLLNSIDQYERGETSLADVERSVDLYVPALEGISYGLRSRLHALLAEAYGQEVPDKELGFERSTEAINELRSIVMALKEQRLLAGIANPTARSGTLAG